MEIKKGKTILHNTATDYVFLAGAVDEKTQLSAKSHNHIKYIGELSVAVNEPYKPYPEIQERNGDTFIMALKSLLNSFSKENGSNTPDYILANYLNDCLELYNKSVMARSEWYGYKDRIGYDLDTEVK